MENLFSCPSCNKEFTSWNGLAKHTSRNHNLSGKDLVMKYYKISEPPKCKCGCGTECTFDKGHSKFREYTKGHLARTNGGFYSKKGGDKSAETRRSRFKSGDIIQWNKGKSYTPEQLKSFQEAAIKPERCKKISDGLKGKPKSPEHAAKMAKVVKEYWSKDENKDKQREVRMQYIINNGLGFSSKLEDIFKEILICLQIEYIPQFYVKDIKALYDFKIKGNNILIEVDGDYYHCNPNIDKFKEPKLAWHFENIIRDKTKNEWAEKNGYTLIRFWEDDIMNNRDKVIQRLLELKSNIR